LITSTITTLYLLPLFYALMEKASLKRGSATKASQLPITTAEV